jgi:hydrogenase maturation protease
MPDNKPHTIVIGVGNESRGDDILGLLAARQLIAQTFEGVQIVEWQGDGTELMHLWSGIERAIVLDTVNSGELPGTLYQFDATEQSIPFRFYSTTSHNFGVGEGIELARALGSLPKQLLVLGVEGKQFELGAPLSPELQESVNTLVERVKELLVNT